MAEPQSTNADVRMGSEVNEAFTAPNIQVPAIFTAPGNTEEVVL